VYTALFAVVVGAYVFLQEEPTASGGAPLRRTAAKTDTKETGPITEEDRTARGRFARIESGGRNVFNPVVAKATLGSAGGRVPTNEIPTEFAGEAGWIYTGNAELDGKRYAGLENKTTKETVLLSSGERWKRSVVTRITTDTLVLTSDSGLIRSVKLPTHEDPAQPMMGAGAGFQPIPVVPPGLSGPIGRGPVASIEPNAGLNAPAMDVRSREQGGRRGEGFAGRDSGRNRGGDWNNEQEHEQG
jgi:hypothetical protein